MRNWRDRAGERPSRAAARPPQGEDEELRPDLKQQTSLSGSIRPAHARHPLPRSARERGLTRGSRQSTGQTSLAAECGHNGSPDQVRRRQRGFSPPLWGVIRVESYFYERQAHAAFRGEPQQSCHRIAAFQLARGPGAHQVCFSIGIEYSRIAGLFSRMWVCCVSSSR